MEIKTKYNLGDKVWWKNSVRTHKGVVTSVNFRNDRSCPQGVIYYEIDGHLTEFYEENLFPTEEELLKEKQ